MKKVHLILIDSIIQKQTAHKKNIIYVVWDEFVKDKRFISLPLIVEENASFYRADYLQWGDDFALKKIKDKSLYDHLKLKDDFPFWWTTNLGQRFNIFSKSNINDVIKSMALMDYLNKNLISPLSIKIISKKKERITFINQWALEKNIPCKYEEKQLSQWRPKSTIIYALFLFRHVLYSVFLRKSAKNGQTEISFFDIFTHLRKEKKFNSNYWGKLVDLLEAKKVNVQWNHLYYRTQERFSFLNAIKRNRGFNSLGINEHHHVLMEQHFGFHLYFKTIKRYLHIRQKGKEVLPQLEKNYNCRKRGINFAPFLGMQFIDSLMGQEALKNCFYSVLIEDVVKQTSLQSKGVYLQEFQSWEIALVHYWKKAKRELLIAAPHSTHRFWDLRYFFGKKSINHFIKDIFPDIIAVNGDYAYDRCIENGYPKTVLKRVEALRYLHHPRKPIIREQRLNKKKKLLICCDYQLSTSKRLFDIVQQAIQKSDFSFEVSVRMHPAFPISPTLMEQYPYQICTKDMITSLEDNDWVITSNLSAIAVDAYYQGCNIAQLSDGLYFNLSPLRGVIDDLLFTDVISLNQLLQRELKGKIIIPYFKLHPLLNEWRKILSI